MNKEIIPAHRHLGLHPFSRNSQQLSSVSCIIKLLIMHCCRPVVLIVTCFYSKKSQPRNGIITLLYIPACLILVGVIQEPALVWWLVINVNCTWITPLQSIGRLYNQVGLNRTCMAIRDVPKQEPILPYSLSTPSTTVSFSILTSCWMRSATCQSYRTRQHCQVPTVNYNNVEILESISTPIRPLHIPIK